MKRISGNYWDHLISILIYALAFGWILLFIENLTLNMLLVTGVTTTLLIWLGVSLKIRFFGKVNSTLHVQLNQNQLVFKDRMVAPHEIESIRIYTDNAARYRFTYIDFVVVSKGVEHPYRIQNRIALTILDLWSKHPKSLERLFKYYPELEEKLKE